jgi:hypothetical protein
MEMSVEVMNIGMSVVSQGKDEKNQGLDGSVHTYHGHLSRIALPNFSMSKIPRSPNSFGLHTQLQLTRECGLALGAVPGFIHKKLLLIFSTTRRRMHFGSLNTARW